MKFSPTTRSLARLVNKADACGWMLAPRQCPCRGSRINVPRFHFTTGPFYFSLIDRPLVGVRSVVILIEGMLARPPLLDLIYYQTLTPQSLIKDPAIGLCYYVVQVNGASEYCWNISKPASEEKGLGHDPAGDRRNTTSEIGRVIEPRTRIMDNTKYIDQHMTCS